MPFTRPPIVRNARTVPLLPSQATSTPSIWNELPIVAHAHSTPLESFSLRGVWHYIVAAGVLGATHLTSQTEGLSTIDDRQQILGIDHVSGPHKKLLNCSAMARPERRLHFHGFERHDDFARLDALTVFDGNR
jgi:hypothetical protein